MNLYHAVLTRQLHIMNPIITDVYPVKTTYQSPIQSPIQSPYPLKATANKATAKGISHSLKERVLTYLEDKWITPMDTLNNLYSTRRQILINKVSGIALVLTSIAMMILLLVTIYHKHVQ